MAYSLPALPYAYNALEPNLDTKTMEIHHTKHHQTYINNINAAIEGTEWEKLSVEELVSKDDLIKQYYTLQDNGFYKCKELEKDEQKILKNYFEKIGFSALNFTDSRSIYQFYDLSNLWGHIQKALENGVKKLKEML